VRYRNVETYSTGMKQRIKLAQALVHDPDLLFLTSPPTAWTRRALRCLSWCAIWRTTRAST
jgi:ABC-type Na+ transport system ATPase subunit NatA